MLDYKEMGSRQSFPSINDKEVAGRVITGTNIVVVENERGAVGDMETVWVLSLCSFKTISQPV